MSEGALPREKMASRQGQASARHWSGIDLQRVRILHHRLSQSFLQRGGEKRRAGWFARCFLRRNINRQKRRWKRVAAGGADRDDGKQAEKRIDRMNKLVCPECQHENEPERVYCHNCGARLDRFALTNEKGTPKENLVETQKRLRRIFSPRGTKVRH